jgi:hypothetical protein
LKAACLLADSAASVVLMSSVSSALPPSSAQPVIAAEVRIVRSDSDAYRMAVACIGWLLLS